MTDWVKRSTKISTGVQFIFGILSLIGFINIQDKPLFLIALLIADVTVQFLEFCFYIFFIQLTELKTYYRYFDWYISTPTMLITLIGMMEYLNDDDVTINYFLSNYTNEIIYIILMNFMMLSFGLLGELGYASKKLSVILGFLPFLATFAVIFIKFARSDDAFILASVVFLIWSLYGFFALLSYEKKNIGYNIIDIFSKNLFGLYIAIYLLLT